MSQTLSPENSEIMAPEEDELETQPHEEAVKLSPAIEQYLEHKKELEQSLERYTQDTWSGLDRLAQTPTGFPADRIELTSDGQEKINETTSPTNIGLFLASIVGARDLGVISSEIATQRIETILTSLEAAPKYEGLFYNWYDTKTGVLPSGDKPFISTVDEAWLVASLMSVQGAVPSLAGRINTLLDQMNFSLLYDSSKSLFYGGYQPEEQQPASWHYDIFNSEPRMASYVGISRFGIPESNLRQLSRSAPTNTDITSEHPKDILPSWGGSAFESAMPTLFVPEKEWSETLQHNHRHYTDVQIQYGADHNNGFWGFSPSEDPSGTYHEYGLPQLAMKEGGYGANSVVTPYASFLALDSEPDEALKNLNNLRETFPSVYRAGFGFTDSVDVQTGEASRACLLPDQAMSFLAAYNYRTDNRLRDYFTSQLTDTVRETLSSIDQESPSAT